MSYLSYQKYGFLSSEFGHQVPFRVSFQPLWLLGSKMLVVICNKSNADFCYRSCFCLVFFIQLVGWNIVLFSYNLENINRAKMIVMQLGQTLKICVCSIWAYSDHKIHIYTYFFLKYLETKFNSGDYFDWQV